MADFGVSRSLRNTVDMSRTQIGTPFYMSPEVLSNGQCVFYS